MCYARAGVLAILYYSLLQYSFMHTYVYTHTHMIPCQDMQTKYNCKPYTIRFYVLFRLSDHAAICGPVCCGCFAADRWRRIVDGRTPLTLPSSYIGPDLHNLTACSRSGEAGAF